MLNFVVICNPMFMIEQTIFLKKYIHVITKIILVVLS